MPVYEYACKGCGHEFEREQRITEDPVKTCPKCKAAKARRLISRTSFVLKGGGWYSDLYSSSGKDSSADSGDKSGDKGGDKSSADAAASSEAASEGGSGKKSKKPESKPAKKDAGTSDKGSGSDPKPSQGSKAA